MVRLLKKNENGSAMVEFALLLPIYAILILGAYFIGEACLVRHQLRCGSRTLAENAGAGRMASYIYDTIEEEISRFNLGAPGQAAQYASGRYETNGMSDYEQESRVEPPKIADYDIVNVLSGNYYYDWSMSRCGMMYRSSSRLTARNAMIFAPEKSAEESSPDKIAGDEYWRDERPGKPEESAPDYTYRRDAPAADFYYGYFDVRAEHHLLMCKLPAGVAVSGDVEKFPYGPMPEPRFFVLAPSDSVLWPLSSVERTRPPRQNPDWPTP